MWVTGEEAAFHMEEIMQGLKAANISNTCEENRKSHRDTSLLLTPRSIFSPRTYCEWSPPTHESRSPYRYGRIRPLY